MLKQYLTSNVKRMVRRSRIRIGQIARGLGLGFFIEGFALYDVSLDPSAAFFVEAGLAAAHVRSARSAGGRSPAVAYGQGGLQSPRESNVVAPELAARAQPCPRRGRSWMSELGEKFLALRAHLRREREIKRAVAALAKYDDRTLRDLGIHVRADIERMVRYCRDC